MVIHFLINMADRDNRENFLLSHGVISETATCENRDNLCTLSHTTKRDFFFRCRKNVHGRRCGFYRSTRKDTFIGGTRMTIQQILTFCAYWCLLPNPRFLTLQEEVEATDKTVVDWSNFCREVCLDWFREVCLDWFYRKRCQIGGPGTIVETDESKFGWPKYNRERIVEGQWVFGGIQQGNARNFFVVPVENRNAETLIQLIKDWILPETTIISDCWKSYNTLQNEGFLHLKGQLLCRVCRHR